MNNKKEDNFAFSKVNYQILTGGLVLVVIGFLLLAGGGSDDHNVFNPEIFSPQRITVAPLTILLGYAVVMYAIMKKPKE